MINFASGLFLSGTPNVVYIPHLSHAWHATFPTYIIVLYLVILLPTLSLGPFAEYKL
jgi:hypothetical protein